MNNDNIINEEQDEDLDILGVIFKYLRYWYWFVLTGAIGMGWAYQYLRQYTPVYEVKASLLIKDDRSKRFSNDIKDEFSLNDPKVIDNEIEVLKSRPLMGKVIDALNLTVSYWKEGSARDEELHTKSPIKVNAKDLTDYAYGNPLYIKPFDDNKYQVVSADQNILGTFDYSQLVKTQHGTFRVFKRDSVSIVDSTPIKVLFQSREGLIGGLAGSLQIAPLKEYYSTIISIGLQTTVPDKGKDILNKLLEEYAFGTLEDKNREATNTLRFIEERLKLVTSELGDVEQNVEQYRRSQGITDLSSEASLFLGKVEENDAKINELDIRENVLNEVERYLNSTQVGNIAPATMMVNDPVLNSYIDQFVQLEAERSKLAQTVQPGNPYLETINNQMKNVKQAIRENLNNQKANIQVSRRSLEALNNRLSGSISTIPRKEREYVGIKRQAGIKENLYLLLLQKREETALSYASTVTDSRVIEAPFLTGQIRPNNKNIYMMAILLALVIPATIIATKELLTNTVQTKKEIERKTGLKVFGEIAIKPKEDKGEIIDTGSRSFISEQIRMIRSNMKYILSNDIHEGIAHVILFTSSTGGEGKTFVATNIAASLALLDKRVVILGLDLRKPTIHSYLGVANKKGISNYLIGKAKAEDIVVSTSINNVYLAPSGPMPPNPSELIANGRIKDLIDELKYSFDYIIMDTPPLGLVTDATLLASYAEATFYLIRYNKTPKMFLSTIKELDRKKTFRSFNLIFNAVNIKKSADYGYGYGYGTQYGGYYGEEKSSKGWFDKLMAKK